LGRGGVLSFRNTFGEDYGFANPLAQLAYRFLVIFVPRRRLPGQPRGSTLHIIARALHMINEILHVRRQPREHQDANVELFGLRELLCLIETGLKVLEAPGALLDELIVHERSFHYSFAFALDCSLGMDALGLFPQSSKCFDIWDRPIADTAAEIGKAFH